MSSEDSSSEEDTEKLKEATWSFVPAKTNGSQTGQTNECGKNGTHSRRTVASEHEKDGNELETTPEFRAHVAKKLGNVLDSCIAEVSLATVNSSSVWSSQEKEREEEKEEEDEGFRLFSTSVPGMSESAPVPSLKRRPLPSSSDSDSEMDTRIKEAAVTISDIVRPYCTEKTEEKKDSADPVESKEDACGSLVTEKKKKKKKNKKKKKKKKIPKLEEDHEEERKDYFNDGNLEIQEESTQETPQLEEKKKRKKKKKVEA
ncbi:protein CUSTOS isoform X2 [Alosa alosa]|nr:protein CUSTOS isoform X2 [Alosa alosa]